MKKETKETLGIIGGIASMMLGLGIMAYVAPDTPNTKKSSKDPTDLLYYDFFNSALDDSDDLEEEPAENNKLYTYSAPNMNYYGYLAYNRKLDVDKKLASLGYMPREDRTDFSDMDYYTYLAYCKEQDTRLELAKSKSRRSL